MLVDLVTILEEPVKKFSNGKTLNTYIHGHVHHKWLAVFAAKPIRGAGIQKNDSVCFTTMTWSVPVAP